MTALETYLTRKSHIIWDWNGTLLDDVDLCVQTMSSLLSKYRLPPLSKDAYRKHFCFPVMEYYRRLGFDFDSVPFVKVADEFITLYKKNIHECRLHPGVSDLLTKLRALGKKHSVLSAAREIDLMDQLGRLQIRDHFDHVYGIADHYAAGKVARGRELLKKIHSHPNDIIMVGDTDHDIDVARELGIEILLLADGHQSYERLQDLHPQVLLSRTI